MTNPTFKFRLGRLLKVRARREDEASVALIAAIATCDHLRAAADDIRGRADEARCVLRAGVGPRGMASDRRVLEYLLQQLDARGEELAANLIEAEAELDVRRRELAARSTERRVLERLRERKGEEWREEDSRQDRLGMDAVALRVALRGGSNRAVARGR